MNKYLVWRTFACVVREDLHHSGRDLLLFFASEVVAHEPIRSKDEAAGVGVHFDDEIELRLCRSRRVSRHVVRSDARKLVAESVMQRGHLVYIDLGRVLGFMIVISRVCRPALRDLVQSTDHYDRVLQRLEVRSYPCYQDDLVLRLKARPKGTSTPGNWMNSSLSSCKTSYRINS